jgi:hypothetical protein
MWVKHSRVDVERLEIPETPLAGADQRRDGMLLRALA